jgi:beta-galactosidase
MNAKLLSPARRCLVATFALAMTFPGGLSASEPRTVLRLDGTWEIAEGALDRPPRSFTAKVPVPGLVDMAVPRFANVGVKSPRREAFWYRRTFRVDGPIADVAVLKVHKAMFGSRVILNGTTLGDHWPLFTPGLFDARPALRSGENELLIRVGASREAVPRAVPAGSDFEKTKYIAGLFDSVELILTGLPHLLRVQAVPDIAARSVTVHVWARVKATPAAVPLRVTVREAATGKVAGAASCNAAAAGDGQEVTGRVTVPLRDCRLWSPDDPFLYEIEVRGTADVLTTRFGMRSFRLDPATGRALLNGRPYFVRGGNVTLYRFFEDAERGDKPWREEWVRRLHRAFRDMNWHALRYCIGFPPEAWYRIADEEGFLIQDEFPIWEGTPKPGILDADELTREYTEWMQERWNHPCVVVWDACNETLSPETGKAIARVRGLDFSGRPWDNGYSPAVDPGDVLELHPYHFANPAFRLSGIASDPGTLGWKPGKNPIIVNEYGWLWLNRDGTPTTLTRQVYKNLLGPGSTTAQRRTLYARTMAAETEFWRARRGCAAVLHFCGLGYSRPDGQTSDHWADVEKLTWDPEFATYVRDAFAPVGVVIDAWADDYPAGQARDVPVVVINDLDRDVRGEVRFRLLHGATVVHESAAPCAVPALGSKTLSFRVAVPRETGAYQLEATLARPGSAPVRSLRDFGVLTDEQRRARDGLAMGKPVKASSNLGRDGATTPEAAVDGQPGTRWSSEFSDPQWIAVDLGRPEHIARVVLDWEAAHARAYALEVSLDGRSWREVYRTDAGRGGSETIRFAPTDARWVRLRGIRRATGFGYSLWEMRVFRE